MKARLPWNGASGQKKAMLAEIDRQILERDAKFTNDFDAMILREHYQMDGDDIPWLCDYKLKNECGIDVAAWNEEKK